MSIDEKKAALRKIGMSETEVESLVRRNPTLEGVAMLRGPGRGLTSRNDKAVSVAQTK